MKNKLNILTIKKSYDTVDAFIGSIFAFFLLKLGFILLPFLVVLLVDLIFLKHEFDIIFASSKFTFALVIISAVNILDYVSYMIGIERKHNNIFYFGLQGRIVFTTFMVLFLSFVLLNEKQILGTEFLIPNFHLAFINIAVFLLLSGISFWTYYLEHTYKVMYGQRYKRKEQPVKIAEGIERDVDVMKIKMNKLIHDIKISEIGVNKDYKLGYKDSSTKLETIVKDTEFNIEQLKLALNNLESAYKDTKIKLMKNQNRA